MKLFFGLFSFFLFTFHSSKGQQPHYTEKLLMNGNDSSKIGSSLLVRDGFGKSFKSVSTEIWDIDDSKTTHFKVSKEDVLIMIEGAYKNGQKSGVFSTYVFDRSGMPFKYKIWEQTYLNDKLDGEWRVFNLEGTLVQSRNYSKGLLNGSSKTLWIDGKTLMEENIYKIGSSDFINRTFNKQGGVATEYLINGEGSIMIAKEFYSSGRIRQEGSFLNEKPDGLSKRYYESGNLMEEANFKEGQFHGTHKYYHPNGKLWIQKEYKNGLPWDIISNFSSDGKQREAGSLKNGNGTIIFYNDDGSVRETITYENGIKK